VLSDLGRLGNRGTPAVLSILVLEDLVMAVYLPILTALLIGVTFLGGLEAVGISLAVIAIVLVVALRQGRYVSMVVDSPDREVFLLKVLGAALLVAGLASALQVSAAVGAFLLGIAIPGSTAHNATRLLEPLRDLFAAVFFVVFGLNTDPRAIPPVLGWAIVLAVTTSLTKLATGWWAARRQGIGKLGRARTDRPRGVLDRHRGTRGVLRRGPDGALRAGHGVRADHGDPGPDRGEVRRAGRQGPAGQTHRSPTEPHRGSVARRVQRHAGSITNGTSVTSRSVKRPRNSRRSGTLLRCSTVSFVGRWPCAPGW
jgi:hypothetical protein